jgi:hypothetical protein
LFVDRHHHQDPRDGGPIPPVSFAPERRESTGQPGGRRRAKDEEGGKGRRDVPLGIEIESGTEPSKVQTAAVDGREIDDETCDREPNDDCKSTLWQIGLFG